MYLVIAGVCLVLTILFTILYIEDIGDEFLHVFLAVFSGIVFLGFAVVTCIDLAEVKTEVVIDNKIAMYEEENARIEAQIDELVKNYMAYESETFNEYKPNESPMTYVSLFPELKSNALVQEQIDIYVANNNKIKSLKEEKISLGRAKWRLYFGT
jgi:hypothetical protein